MGQLSRCSTSSPYAGDLALFTVYPSLGIVLAGTHRSKDTVDPAMGFLAPAMYWYGWTATAVDVPVFSQSFALGLPQRDHKLGPLPTRALGAP